MVWVLTVSSAFAATDLTQELDGKWWTLKVNNSLTINYDEGSFEETVIFNARTVSQLEWGIDSSKYDDKWAEVLYISFKNNIGLATIPQKDISLGYNNLQNYDNPVLLTFNNNKLVVINGTDNAWTYVFKLAGAIDWAYKIVDNLVWSNESTTSILDDSIDLLWNTSEEEMEIDLNSAWEEPTEVLLADKPTKWAEDFYILILILFLIVATFWGIKLYKNS